MSLLDNITPKTIEEYTRHLNPNDKMQLVSYIETLSDLRKKRMFFNMFKDKEKYKKHMEFIELGTKKRERLFMAGNRVGKTILGCFELTAHVTGHYPDWWCGKRFNKPITVWIGGDTTMTVRDIIQSKLLGNVGEFGTGMIPAEYIIDTKPKRNVPDAVETILVRHNSGGVSRIVLKTYEQGRETWQGTEIDIIWLDEEPPLDVYSEALIRTMTTGGIVMLTFTPLRGMSDVVMAFLNADETSSKATVMATWDDVPHLSDEMKRELLMSIPLNERDARSKGVPVIGSGRIWPCGEEVFVEDFQIPKYWARAYALDVGWNKTACLWGAWDRDNDIVYIYSEHYGSHSEPVVHAEAIKKRGDWIKGVIDPASRGRSQVDGKALFDMYSSLGLKIVPANNAVEAGIYDVWQRIATGRLKIFKTCGNLKREVDLYHRDDQGKIVKKQDHLCDCLRYLCMSGLQVAQVQLQVAPQKRVSNVSYLSWT